MTRPLLAYIDHAALQHNLTRVRQIAPHSQLMAVVKADAYGLGMSCVLPALQQADAFAVAAVEEGIELRNLVAGKPIVILSSFCDCSDIPVMLDHRLSPLIHHISQIEILESTSLDAKLDIWLKMDSGMHRLVQ